MTSAETPNQTASRLAREDREIAGSLPFDERANLLCEITKAVRDAVKFDATFGGAHRVRCRPAHRGRRVRVPCRAGGDARTLLRPLAGCIRPDGIRQGVGCRGSRAAPPRRARRARGRRRRHRGRRPAAFHRARCGLGVEGGDRRPAAPRSRNRDSRHPRWGRRDIGSRGARRNEPVWLNHNWSGPGSSGSSRRPKKSSDACEGRRSLVDGLQERAIHAASADGLEDEVVGVNVRHDRDCRHHSSLLAGIMMLVSAGAVDRQRYSRQQPTDSPGRRSARSPIIHEGHRLNSRTGCRSIACPVPLSITTLREGLVSR